jgi:hypothetical protein
MRELLRLVGATPGAIETLLGVRNMSSLLAPDLLVASILLILAVR